MAADPYTTLGVSRSASAEDIKKAYRKLAHQYHPDKKGGNEAKFKEVNEAYQILGDAEKKSRFDQFGHAGVGGPGAGGFGGRGAQDFNFDFSGVGDIFDMFTGGFGAGGSPRRAEKGEDLHLNVTVSAKDLGQHKVYEFDAFDVCATCTSSGVAPGAKLRECSSCKGAGRVRQSVRTPFGTFAQVGICPVCEGDGKIPEKKCGDCGGTGRVKKRRKLDVKLPASLDDRYLMAFPQEGNAGPQGAPPGDLTLTLRVK